MNPADVLTSYSKLLPKVTAPSTTRVCIDDEVFWHAFLRKLSHTDPEYDARVIQSLCETLHVKPERVLAKMKAHMHYADATTAQH